MERPALRRVPACSRRPSDLPIRHHEAPAASPRRHLRSDVLHYVNLRTQFCDAFHKLGLREAPSFVVTARTGGANKNRGRGAEGAAPQLCRRKGNAANLVDLSPGNGCVGVSGVSCVAGGSNAGPNSPRPCATNGGKHDGRTFRTCQRTSAVLPEPRRPHRSCESAKAGLPPRCRKEKSPARGRTLCPWLAISVRRGRYSTC